LEGQAEVNNIYICIVSHQLKLDLNYVLCLECIAMLRLRHGFKPTPTLVRYISTKPIIRIPKSSIHPFGDPSNQRPILQNVDWTINEGEAWAVMSASSGDSGKSAIFQVRPELSVCEISSLIENLKTLQGHLRILSDPKDPPQHGLYPFLGRDIDPYSRVSAVSFSHNSNRGGAFYDYTARYGAIRDEDALTLRESMFPESIQDDKPDPLAVSPSEKPKVKKRAFEDVVKLSNEDKALFDSLVKEMDLERLLDLPLIALSNGQTRRARIVRAVLTKPEIILLDEPLSQFVNSPLVIFYCMAH
jgi:ABC-type iron transport system FetAB ATPase subunit